MKSTSCCCYWAAQQQQRQIGCHCFIQQGRSYWGDEILQAPLQSLRLVLLAAGCTFPTIFDVTLCVIFTTKKLFIVILRIFLW
jgi:hypothetical protein